MRVDCFAGSCLRNEWLSSEFRCLFWASKLLLVCCDKLEESSVLNAVAVIFLISFISRGLSFGTNLPEFICFSLSDSYFALLTSLGSANNLGSFDFLMILFVFFLRLWLREGMEAARSLISFYWGTSFLFDDDCYWFWTFLRVLYGLEILFFLWCKNNRRIVVRHNMQEGSHLLALNVRVLDLTSCVEDLLGFYLHIIIIILFWILAWSVC